MLIVVRLFSGAMQSNASVANAYVADITPPEDRAKRFGLLGAMFGLGFILGPVMGGLLGAIDLHLPFFAAGALALLNLLYGWFVLPESLPPTGAGRSTGGPRSTRCRRSPSSASCSGVGLLVAVIACTALAQFVLYTSWVLYTTFKFGWGPLQNGWSLFAVGVRLGAGPGLPARPAAEALLAAAAGDLSAWSRRRSPTSATGAADRGLDDVRRDLLPTSSASPSPRRSRASSRAPPTRPRRAGRWAR